jgi:hypothetical protein
MAWFLLDEDNDIELEFDDDVPEEEGLAWYEEAANSVKDFFVGEPVQPPIYSDASGQFEQVRKQAPLVTEEATRSWEPYITGEMARDVIVGSEMLARNLAGQRVDTSEDIAAATAGVGVTGAGSTAFSKPTPGVVRQFIGSKGADFDKMARNTASYMEIEGKTPLEIFQKTNTFRGTDGEWRQYKSNADFLINEGKIDKVFADKAFREQGKVFEGKVKDVMPTNDPLIANYPHLKDYTVKIVYDPYSPKGHPSGAFHEAEKVIEINAVDPYDAKIALVHEGQHGIQYAQDWTIGTAPANFYSRHIRTKDIPTETKTKLNAVAGKAGYKWDEKLPPKENLQNLRDEFKDYVKNIIRVKGVKAATKLTEDLKFLNKQIEEFDAMLEAKPTARRRYLTNMGEADARLAEVTAIEVPEGKHPMEFLDVPANELHKDILDSGAPTVASKNKSYSAPRFPSVFGDLE